MALLISRTQAVQALENGCARLGLPLTTAPALVQFLSAKRVHDQFVAHKQLNMSPGASLDRLWHWMLLNTAVSSQVHELVGGVVEHRGTDESDLCDETKVLQRLYALNILRLEGAEPDVALWRDPGTAMNTLHLAPSGVAALAQLPGNGYVYITPNLTPQQQHTLTQALQQLCGGSSNKSGAAAAGAGAAAGAAAAGGAGARTAGGSGSKQDVQDTQPGADQSRQASAKSPRRPLGAAAAGAGAVAAGGKDNEPPAKRTRLQQASQQKQHEQQHPQVQQAANSPGQSDKMTISVKDLMGRKVFFTLTPNITVRRVLALVCDVWALELNAVRAVFNGERPCWEASVGSIGMRDGDTLDLFLIQTGC